MKIKGRNAVREALNSDTNILKILASNNSKDKTFMDIISTFSCVRADSARILFRHDKRRYFAS